MGYLLVGAAFGRSSLGNGHKICLSIALSRLGRIMLCSSITSRGIIDGYTVHGRLSDPMPALANDISSSISRQGRYLLRLSATSPSSTSLHRRL
jgi:hypothetical protein